MEEIRWKTYSHIFNPYGNLIWHLFWGIVLGICYVLAILNYDFWLLVFSILALIFFFYPDFYKPQLLEIKLTKDGFFIDEKFYPWIDFTHFEIFGNEFRKFVYISSEKTKRGVHFPLEEFFVSEEKVKSFISQFLKEKTDLVPFLDKLYRNIFL